MTFKHVRGVSLRRSLACVAGASVLALTLAQGAVAQDNDDEGDVVIATGIRQAVSYTHLRAHETREDLVCRLLL